MTSLSEPMGLPTPTPISELRALDIFPDRVTLEWEPSDESAIRSYIIERLEEPTTRWSRIASLPVSMKRYTVPDLDEGREYRFRIRTETHEGLTHIPIEYDLPITTERRAGKVLSSPYND